jgi:carbonic anhydrase/acetyltransferase-like protein (isoleucine patch superfamily)
MSLDMNKLERQFVKHLRKKPAIGKGVYIAKGAVVLGDVSLGAYSSVWFNAVLRGDINRIVVGHHTNIQDNAVLHLSDTLPCILGNYVSVGHSAILHACTVRDGALVGMGATILDGAIIGEESIVGARALVTRGERIPPGSLVLGVPGKVTRALTRQERAELNSLARKYAHAAGYYLKHRINVLIPGIPDAGFGVPRRAA